MKWVRELLSVHDSICAVGFCIKTLLSSNNNAPKWLIRCDTNSYFPVKSLLNDGKAKETIMMQQLRCR